MFNLKLENFYILLFKISSSEFQFLKFCSSSKVLSKYVIIFGNITLINMLVIARRKSDANMHVFLYCQVNLLETQPLSSECREKLSSSEQWEAESKQQRAFCAFLSEHTHSTALHNLNNRSPFLSLFHAFLSFVSLDWKSPFEWKSASVTVVEDSAIKDPNSWEHGVRKLLRTELDQELEQVGPIQVYVLEYGTGFG